MAGDLPIEEHVIISESEGALAARAPAEGGPVIHRYGRVGIVSGPAGDQGLDVRTDSAAGPEELTELETLGLAAFRLRESPDYVAAKADRYRAGEQWDMPNCTDIVPNPTDESPQFPESTEEGGAKAFRAGPTSAYLQGSVAVGIVIVQGPGALAFTAAERTSVIAEVQNGLGFFPSTNPGMNISFTYDIQVVTLALPAAGGGADLEGYWRNPSMAALGFAANFDGVRAYVESLRTRFGTRWTYCGFFTKYPVQHFAYASIGGPRVVMDYANDGWGPGNIDRVFAHETGHIFGAPDEYASSGCDCGGSWGRFGLPNGNCENCAAGVSCLMRANDFTMCAFTPSHLGWTPRLAVNNFGYGAGGWRVDQHPRFALDTTGDGRADILGFGNAGLYRSKALPGATFGPVELLINNFGQDAGGWRVDKHPRLFADTTGDGRPDVIGFGTAGVYRSKGLAGGGFGPVEFVVANFGYDGGGWRVNQHPRFVADTTGDGRADIVGFGNAGVYRSRAQTDGSFGPVELVVNNFGYVAGGWRVDQHPRFVVDTTGDGRADIVGFGNAGVYRSKALADGSFGPVELVVANFGYVAGGWRVDQHPRYVVDTTGDGRADIVGFGNAGVYRSLAQADGSYGPVELIVSNFGYNAGGWRVNQHPRLLADTTGDGKADIIGFGNAGVYLSRAKADNTYEATILVISNFGYAAGGWRVESHPRLAADVTGEGRADILGFGTAGVHLSVSRPDGGFD